MNAILLLVQNQKTECPSSAAVDGGADGPASTLSSTVPIAMPLATTAEDIPEVLGGLGGLHVVGSSAAVFLRFLLLAPGLRLPLARPWEHHFQGVRPERAFDPNFTAVQVNVYLRFLILRVRDVEAEGVGLALVLVVLELL